MTVAHKITVALALVLGILIAIVGWNLITEREARIAAETTVKVKEADKVAAQQDIQSSLKTLKDQLAQVQHERQQPITAPTFIVQAAKLLPTMPKPLEMVTVPAVVTVDDKGKTVTTPARTDVLIPEEDLASFRNFKLDCDAKSFRLDSCVQVSADKDRQLVATEAERDAYKTEARGGTWAQRFKRAGKWFVIGAGAGAAGYAIAHR